MTGIYGQQQQQQQRFIHLIFFMCVNFRKKGNYII